MSKNKAIQKFFSENPEFQQDLSKTNAQEKLDLFLKIAKKTDFIPEIITDELTRENLLNNVDDLNQSKIDCISKILIDPQFNSIKDFLQNSTGSLMGQYKSYKAIENLYELADIDLYMATLILSNPGFEDLRQFIKNEPYALKELSNLDLDSLEIANDIVKNQDFKDEEISKENLKKLLQQTKNKSENKRNIIGCLLYATSFLYSTSTLIIKRDRIRKNIKIDEPTDTYSYYKDSYIFDPKMKLFMNHFSDRNINSRFMDVFKALKEENLPKLKKFLESKQNIDFAYFYPERLEYALELEKSAQDKYIENFIKPQFAHEKLMHNTFYTKQPIENYNLSPISEIFKSNLKGPWKIDPRCYEIMDKLGENIHLSIPLKYLSLYDLSDFNKIHPIVFAPLKTTRGFATPNLEIVVSTEQDLDHQLATTVHEAMHRVYFTENLIFSRPRSANPYGASDFNNERIFKSSMQEVIENLHNRYFSGEETPTDIRTIVEELDNKSFNLLEPDRSIIQEITGMFYMYRTDQYDSEFVVRIPQFIAMYDGLPVHLIDDFMPILNYYKTVSTPRFLDYIESHPMKHMLLEKDTDKYYPETLLSVAGETRLLTKKNPTKEERLLINQMNKMKEFFEKGDNNAIAAFLPNLKDERVIRYSLNLAIQNGNLDVFGKIYDMIQAPQYLGPQLMEAARLNMTQMIPKLEQKVTDQYFLDKAAHPETIPAPLNMNNTGDIIKTGSTNIPIKPVAAVVTATSIYAGYKIFRHIANTISDYFTPNEIVEIKDLDKKLLLLEEQFNLLAEKYKNIKNTEKAEYFESLKIETEKTLQKLNNLNSSTINNKKEQREKAIAIFESFKALKKEKDKMVKARYEESKTGVNFSKEEREKIDQELKGVNLQGIKRYNASTSNIPNKKVRQDDSIMKN